MQCVPYIHFILECLPLKARDVRDVQEFDKCDMIKGNESHVGSIQ